MLPAEAGGLKFMAPDAASEGNAPGIPQLTGSVQSTPSGLKYIDELVGNGTTVHAGQVTQSPPHSAS